MTFIYRKNIDNNFIWEGSINQDMWETFKQHRIPLPNSLICTSVNITAGIYVSSGSSLFLLPKITSINHIVSQVIFNGNIQFNQKSLFQKQNQTILADEVHDHFNFCCCVFLAKLPKWTHCGLKYSNPENNFPLPILTPRCDSIQQNNKKVLNHCY